MTMTGPSAMAEMLRTMQAVDLSHTLEEHMQIAPSHSRYYHTLWDSHETGSIALANQLIMNEHTGTHVDATAHFMAKGDPAHRYIDETPLSQFYGRALTIDCSHYDDRGLVTVEEIEDWQRRSGLSIEPGDIVLFRFGWDRYWVPRTISRDYVKSWPGLSREAAQYLVGKQVKTVGCDTIAIDSSYKSDAPVHYVLLGNGVNIIENLTRLDQVLGECFLFVLPLKVKEGSGSPVRALAFK